MEIKLLEAKEIGEMQTVIEDDDMVFNKDNLTKFINTQNCYGFIAKEKKNIIGFAYGYALTRPDNKIMFYLHSIGVLEKYQNNGTGTLMMNFIVDFAKKQGFSEIFVITDKANKRACHVYEKTGFTNDIPNEICYVNEFKG